MGLENFILTCEKDNEQLRKDIDYYKNYNKRLKKENQELKKQLEDMTLCRDIASGHRKEVQDRETILLNQQKEFIEWLEKEIQGQEDYAVSFGLTIDYGIAEYTSGKIDALKESLSKYKEIYKLLETLDMDKYAERINDDPRYDNLEPIEFREHINHVKEQMMKDIDKGE